MHCRVQSQRYSPALAPAFAGRLTTGAGSSRGVATGAIGVVLFLFQVGCGGTGTPATTPASPIAITSAVPADSPIEPLPAPETAPGRVVSNAAPAAPATSAGGVAPAPRAERIDLPELKGRVVRGNPDLARSVAVVDIARCFEAIPSYRSMRADRGSRDYARYLLNVAEANDEFRDAVEWIAIHEGIDLVVEKSALPERSVADITELVCDRLESPSVALTR